MTPYKALIWLGVVDHASNLSTQKAEAGEHDFKVSLICTVSSLTARPI